MGAKSTVDITRGEALSFIVNRLAHMDNEAISRLLENVNDEVEQRGDSANALGLHNFRVKDVKCDGDGEFSSE